MSPPRTQYSRAMRAKRQEEKQRERDRGAIAVGGARCGAKKRDGTKCRLAAGQGTTHVGTGKCRFHGGNLPSHVARGAKQQAILLGAPREINPLDAIIWCIRMTSGEIDFYTEQMQYIEKENWLEDTVLGKQMHIFARERALCQERLVKFSKDAIQLGLTERAVKLAEQYGSTISSLIRGILDDLMPHIDAEGQKKIPKIVRHHLLLAEQGQQHLHKFASKQIAALEATT